VAGGDGVLGPGAALDAAGQGRRDAKAMLVAGASLWVVNASDNSVSQVDVASGAARRTISVGLTPTAVTLFNGSVWVANPGDNTISRIDA
jgi:YVTN family beta-propeller protein